MDEISFEKQLNELINNIKSASDNCANPSYSNLLKKLSNFTVANISEQKDSVSYFITDSYDYNKEIGDKVAEFIYLYTTGPKR